MNDYSHDGRINCRICFEPIEFHQMVKNLCKCTDVYFHEECAIKWFTPRVRGISKGKALQKNWTTSWYASCEVCNSNIDNIFVQKCILSLKRESFEQLKKICMNPNILPHVPEVPINTTSINSPRAATINSHIISRRRMNRNRFICCLRED